MEKYPECADFRKKLKNAANMQGGTYKRSPRPPPWSLRAPVKIMSTQVVDESAEKFQIKQLSDVTGKSSTEF